MLLSAIGSAFVGDATLLMLARWLGGLGVGISAMVCPLYISEISPSHLRGRMVTMFQFAITIGIVFALLSNYILHDLAENMKDSGLNDFLQWILVDETWRAMFAAELLPGICFAVMALLLPESPRWLVKVGRLDEAGEVLKRVFIEGADAEFSAIKKAIQEEDEVKGTYKDLLDPKYRKYLLMAISFAIFSQFSGINVIFYYGPSLLENAGLGAGGALSGFAVIGFLNMIFTVIALWGVDKLGRKVLLKWGTVGCVVCLISVGTMLGDAADASMLLIVLICAFVGFFACSVGPIKFIFASEIFPTKIRANALSIVILFMWTADTIVGQLFPIFRDSLGASLTFFIFAATLAPQLWVIWKFMPETAGRSLEEIEGWYNHGK